MGSPFCWRSTEPWKPLGSMSLCGISACGNDEGASMRGLGVEPLIWPN